MYLCGDPDHSRHRLAGRGAHSYFCQDVSPTQVLAVTKGQDAVSQAGSRNTFGNTGVGGQTFGGGAILGVAGKSDHPTLRIYNKKKAYDEWMFIYIAMAERQKRFMGGPYNGMRFVGRPVDFPPGK